MQQAMSLFYEELTGKATIERHVILEYIATSHYVMGDLKKALSYTIELIAAQPDHPRANGNKIYFESISGMGLMSSLILALNALSTD